MMNSEEYGAKAVRLVVVEEQGRVGAQATALARRFKQRPSVLVLLALLFVLVAWPMNDLSSMLSYVVLFGGFLLTRAVLAHLGLNRADHRPWVAYVSLALVPLCAAALINLVVLQSLPKADLLQRFLLSLMICSSLLVCMHRLACSPAVFLLFSLGITLPSAAWLGLQGGSAEQGLALLLVLCALASNVSAWVLHRSQGQFSAVQDQLRQSHFQHEQSLEAGERLEDKNAKLQEWVKQQEYEQSLLNDQSRQVQRFKLRLKESEAAQQLGSQRLSAILDSNDLHIWEWDCQLDRFLQPQAEELLGLSMDGEEGFVATLKPLVSPATLEQIKLALHTFLLGDQEHYHMQFQVRHQHGHILWLEDRGTANAWDEQGRITQVIGSRRIVSAQKRVELYSELFEAMFSQSEQAAFVLDHNFRVLSANAAFIDQSEYSLAEIEGRRFIDLSGEGSDEKKIEAYTHIAKVLHQEGQWSGSVVGSRRNGEALPINLSVRRVEMPGTAQAFYLGSQSDQSKAHETQQRLAYLSTHDALTDLANRSACQHNLDECMRQQQPLAYLQINIDRFKQVNEALGQNVGDELLCQFSQRLKRYAKDAKLISRVGSDEFSLILVSQLRLGSLSEFTQRLCQKLAKVYQVFEHEVCISVSIGISLYPEHCRDAPSLQQQAALAMLQSKAQGGSNYQFYTSNLQPQNTEQLELEAELRKAIARKDIKMHFQPKFCLQSNRIVAVEALVRWQHERLGMISPERFIHLAEAGGLIGPLGEQILEMSCLQAKRWQEEGFEDICVAVNLSAKELANPQIATQIQQQLQTKQLPSHLLEIEITESVLLEDNKCVSRNLERIRAMGLKLSIDDFGTGYASLSYLQKLPVSGLKIDRSFITNIPDNENDCAITKAILAMASTLKLKVVAEGVETQDHVDFLRAHGCDQIQGYYLSRAISAQAMTAMLRKEHELLACEV